MRIFAPSTIRDKVLLTKFVKLKTLIAMKKSITGDCAAFRHGVRRAGRCTESA